MGEESSDSAYRYSTPDKVIVALDKGLDWIATAQTNSGGWGAGSHNRQDLMDPHAVQADPSHYVYGGDGTAEKWQFFDHWKVFQPT